MHACPFHTESEQAGADEEKPRRANQPPLFRVKYRTARFGHTLNGDYGEDALSKAQHAYPKNKSTKTTFHEVICMIEHWLH